MRTHYIFDFLNNNSMKISDYMHFMTPEHYVKTRLSYPELRYDVVNGIIICAKHRERQATRKRNKGNEDDEKIKKML